MTVLPEADCQYGYTAEQLRLILGDHFDEFIEWMYGQTWAICSRDPQRMWIEDPAARGGMRLVETGPPLCGEAHGVVVYLWDLENYLNGGPILD